MIAITRFDTNNEKAIFIAWLIFTSVALLTKLGISGLFFGSISLNGKCHYGIIAVCGNQGSIAVWIYD